MGKPTTTHRPTQEELLEAMQLLYGDVADWENVRVYVPDTDGGETVVNNPTIEFCGELNPQVPEEEAGVTEEYEDALQEIKEQQNEDNE